MNIQPLSDRVLIKPISGEEKTAGGIIVPDTAKEKPMKGEIVAVGPGKMGDDGKRISMDVKKGDKVLYGKYSGTEFKLDDQEYLIMNQDDILATLK
ncbi:MAG: co-chaperone GroES [Calditrichaceae bacterium]|nr:co-chaperone GroES [Calditrichaceae bacterium]MBN2708486.1 co-chaperone GroES [Calditrichaceae bacterium]RQV91957.1 MAG: co-chaperone GroES [Calditrichota bacterium]